MDMTSHLAQGSYEVVMSGQFTFNDHPEFREVLNHIAMHGVQQIVLDLDRVTFVDSAALGMLLLAADEVQKHQKRLLVRNANGQVKKMFDMANFSTMFNLQ
jgi:HptB-dependent secretion and biofilm anti anti-sigma factor